MRTTMKRSSILGTVLVLLLGAGIAFAAWTSTGTGSGSVTATKAQALSVSATAAAGLYPTGSVPVTVTVTNPNEYDVQLSSLEFVNATTTKTGCDATVISGVDRTMLTDVAAGGGGTATVSVDVAMSNLAADACQDAVFTVNFKATGASTS
jgi:hypothetical protein